MRARSIIVYSALRLLAFLVPLGIMMLIPIFHELYWFAIGFSAIIGISLSMIFLGGPREQVAEELAARRKKRSRRTVEDEDEEIEDVANDLARGAAPDDAAPVETPTRRSEAS